MVGWSLLPRFPPPLFEPLPFPSFDPFPGIPNAPPGPMGKPRPGRMVVPWSSPGAAIQPIPKPIRPKMRAPTTIRSQIGTATVPRRVGGGTSAGDGQGGVPVAVAAGTDCVGSVVAAGGSGCGSGSGATGSSGASSVIDPLLQVLWWWSAVVARPVQHVNR